MRERNDITIARYKYIFAMFIYIVSQLMIGPWDMRL